MTMQTQKQLIPILACLLAATLWGIFWYPLRLLDGMGVNGIWTSLIIYGIATAIMLPAYAKQAATQKVKIKYVFLIAFFAGWTNMAFILAALDGKIVRVLLLFYLSPVWAILIARFVLKETITLKIVFLSALALTGAIMMLWDAQQWSSALSLSDYLALSAGFAFAVNNALMRKTGDLGIISKMFYAFLGGSLLALIAILCIAMPVPNFSNASLLLLIIIACPFILIMTGCAQYGATLLPLSLSSIIFLIEIIVGAISAAVLAAEGILIREYVGGTILIFAATAIAIAQSSDSSCEKS